MRTGYGQHASHVDAAVDASAAPTRLAAARKAARAEAVTGIIEQLAKADREGRTAALDGLVKAGSIAWSRLAELLQDDRLAIRAAAATVLAKSTKADLPFDPFAPLEARTQQAQAWAAWVAEHAVKAEIETTPAI